MSNEDIKKLAYEFEQRLLNQEVNEAEPNKDLKLAQWQLDLRQELDELAHQWRGDFLETDQDGRSVWVNHSDMKIMNEQGIRKIIGNCWIINRNIFLTNMDDKKIDRLMLIYSFSLTDFLIMNYRDFDINHKNLTMIKETLVMMIYPALKRGLNAGERDAIYKTQKSVEVTGNRGPLPDLDQKRGIISKIFRRGNK